MNINDTVGQRYGSEEHQTACGRPYRSGRMYFPPCDINKQGFCNTPGNTYPWHAMKRFVHDNQGLMKRMYGDQRHGHVLRSELQNNLDILDSHGETFIAPKYFEYDEGTENDLFQDNDMPVEENEARLFPDSIADEALYNTKFVFSEEPVISIKLSNLQSGHRLGPIIEKTATITELINNETVDHITETADYNITTETDDEQIISTTSQILNTDDDSSEKYTEDQKNKRKFK
ncbi:hypothetical protein NQ315_005981 [Exocentrus adspersus]|uniref:Uncharacterized protein n=1 Tax=Exocentrus adspersus TaxID=1586481 RepID=A0AAV8VCG6_9CUCU|nr:hypothetical protein NQ315_005981 [Exocentrus adspersus]